MTLAASSRNASGRFVIGVIMLMACCAFAVLPRSAWSAETEPKQEQAQPDSRIRSMDALSVVLLRATAPKDSRTAATLGAKREGSGIVIDNSGLILTIGYLILEADGIELFAADGKARPATLVGYDHPTGFGLVRPTVPRSVKPIEFGASETLPGREPVLIAGFDGVAPAYVVSKR